MWLTEVTPGALIISRALTEVVHGADYLLSSWLGAVMGEVPFLSTVEAFLGVLWSSGINVHQSPCRLHSGGNGQGRCQRSGEGGVVREECFCIIHLEEENGCDGAGIILGGWVMVCWRCW